MVGFRYFLVFYGFLKTDVGIGFQKYRDIGRYIGYSFQLSHSTILWRGSCVVVMWLWRGCVVGVVAVVVVWL